jgi:hypothetical protein
MATTKHIHLKGTAATQAMRRDLKQLARESRNAAKSAGEATKKTSKWGQGMRSLQSNVGTLTKALGALGLIAAARGAASAFHDMAMRGAKVEGVMNNLVLNIDGAKRATHNMVSEFDLARMANSALVLKVSKSGEEFTKLAGDAEKLGRAVGKGPVESMAALIEGLGRGSTEMLDNVGVTMRAGDAHREFAKRLGTTVSQLTEQQRRQAIVTIGLERVGTEAAKVTGELSDGAMAAMEFTAQWENLKDELAKTTAESGVMETLNRQLLETRNWMTFLRGEGELTTDMFFNLADAVDHTAKAQENLNTAISEEMLLELKRGGVASLKETSFGMEIEAMRKQAAKTQHRKKRKKGGGDSGGRVSRAAAGFEGRAGEAAERAQEAFDVNMDDVRASLDELESLYAASADKRLAGRLREIEMRHEMGADPLQLIEEEKRARLEYLDFQERQAETDAQRLLIQNDREQTLHEARLARMREIERREQEHARKRQMITDSISAGLMGGAAIAEEAARMSGRGEAAAHGVAMVILAAVETAKAAASFASLNIPQGIAHTTAATLATMASVQAFAEAGAGAGRSGGGRRYNNPGPGIGPGGGGGHDQPTAGSHGGGAVPRSRPQQQSLIGGGGGLVGGGGGPREVHFHVGHLIGESGKEEVIRWVDEADHMMGRRA